MTARQSWQTRMLKKMDMGEVARLMRIHNTEDPWFYVEWKRAQPAIRDSIDS